jgi:hypothetical protein
LGLSTFGGGDWVSADDLAPAAEFNTDATGSDGSLASDPDDPDAPEDNETAAEPESDLESDTEVLTDEADEIDSPIQASVSVNAFQLPPLPLSTRTDAEIESVELIDASITDVSLLFPTETSISVVAKGDAWEITDTNDQVTLARLESNSGDLDERKEPGLHFRWSTEASRKTVARQLASGLLNLSLKEGAKRPMFLRPSLAAEPWLVDFSRGDVKAAWPISLAPPVGPSSITLEFKVPETVVHSWIEPHDPSKVRRSQSICQFVLDSDDTIAVRSRIDLKTGSRIQLRMRHAAQLDPSFPWQMISTDQVEQASAHVSDHLERATFEAAELKSAYYEASTSEKKVLGPRRDAIDSVVLRLETLNKRLSKFDQLLAQLNQTALMTIQLQVKWPEGSPLATQTIFEMTPP